MPIYPPVLEMGLPKTIDIGSAERRKQPLFSRGAVKEASPKPVMPEAIQRVREKLSTHMGALQEQQKRLADNLAAGNCVKLEQLSFDYSGEIERYRNAIEALGSNNSALARQLLEKQVCQNMKNMEDLTRYQQSLSEENSQTFKLLKLAKSKLKVSIFDKMKLSSFETAQFELYKYFASVVDREQPELRKPRTQEDWLRRDAEIKRRANARGSPRHIAEYALALSDPRVKQWAEREKNKLPSHRLVYTQLLYSEYQALQEHRNSMAQIVGAHENYQLQNMETDDMIENLGGSRRGDTQRVKERQKNIQELLAESEADPETHYDLILANAQNSPALAEEQMVRTYLQFQREQQGIEQSIRSCKDPNQAKIFKLERSRRTLLSYRLQQIWEAHRRRHPQEGSALPYTGVPRLHDLGEIAREKTFGEKESGVRD